MIIAWKGVYLGWDCTCFNHQPRWRLINTYHSLCRPPARAIHCDWPAWPWPGCQPSSKRPQFWWRRPREGRLPSAACTAHSPTVQQCRCGRPACCGQEPMQAGQAGGASQPLPGLQVFGSRQRSRLASSDPLAPGSAPTPRQGQARPSSPRKVATDTKKSDHLPHLRETRSAGSCWDAGRHLRMTRSAICCCSRELF
jgi:hypothetical protein